MNAWNIMKQKREKQTTRQIADAWAGTDQGLNLIDLNSIRRALEEGMPNLADDILYEKITAAFLAGAKSRDL